MVRTQIQLTEDQHRRLRRWAAERHMSMAEAIRRLVTDRLAAEGAGPTRAALVREAMAVAGAYRDPAGVTGVAKHHDAHLARAFRP